MTKEQEGAIKECEALKKCLIIYSDDLDNVKSGKALETVLNMLKEKDAEIEKKDKMIDLMAEHICNSAIVDDTVCAIKCDCETDIEEDCTHEKMINCTKQYFERKVEDECKR